MYLEKKRVVVERANGRRVDGDGEVGPMPANALTFENTLTEQDFCVAYLHMLKMQERVEAKRVGANSAWLVIVLTIGGVFGPWPMWLAMLLVSFPLAFLAGIPASYAVYRRHTAPRRAARQLQKEFPTFFEATNVELAEEGAQMRGGDFHLHITWRELALAAPVKGRFVMISNSGHVIALGPQTVERIGAATLLDAVAHFRRRASATQSFTDEEFAAVRIEFDWTPAEQHALDAYGVDHIFHHRYRGAVLLLACCAVVALGHANGGAWAFDLAVGTAVLALWTTRWWWRPLSRLLRQTQSEVARMHVGFGPSGISTSWNGQAARYTWPEVTEVGHSMGCTVVLIQDERIVVPDRALPEGTSGDDLVSRLAAWRASAPLPALRSGGSALPSNERDNPFAPPASHPE